MKFRQRLKAFTQMTFSNVSSWSSWLLPASVRKIQAIKDARMASAIMAPLLWAVRTFPEAPMRVQKELPDGTFETVGNHELTRLMRRPNPFYTGTVLQMGLVMDLLADGNAYALLVKNQADRPRQAWYVPGSVMEPKGDENNLITHYEYTVNGVPRKLEVDDVLHLRYGIDPDNPRLGFSPLKSVLREAFTDEEAAQFTQSLLTNMGVPGLLVSPAVGQPAPGEEDVKAAKTYIRDNFNGDKRGEPLVMAGATNVEQFGFSPEQLDLRALRRIPEERISAVLGVAAIVAGLGAGLDRSTFANFAEAREFSYESCIMFLQRLIGEELALQLMPMYEDDPESFVVNYDLSEVRVLQEDENKKVERIVAGVEAGALTVAYLQREGFGIEPDKADEVYLRGLNIVAVPVGEVPEPIDIGPVTEPPPAADPADEELQPSKMRFKASDTDRSARLLAALRRSLVTVEKPLVKELVPDFMALGASAAASFLVHAGDEFSKAADGPWVQDRIYSDFVEKSLPTEVRIKKGDAAIADQVIKDLNLREWSDTHLKKPMERHYVRVAGATQSTINEVYDLGVSLPSPAEKRLLDLGGTRAGLIDVQKDTRSAIIKAIAEGRDDQLGAKEIARTIREYVPAGRYTELAKQELPDGTNKGVAYRSELIARAESKTAQNAASLEVYKATDTLTGVKAADARIGDEHDVDCEARDGVSFTFEEAEAEDLTHPNCSLSWTPEID